MAKILLVDDDIDFIQINKTFLEREGHEVIAAYNPEEGMKMLKSEKPALLILDVMMQEPDDGFAMAQKIRREKNHTPIIMLTSISKITGLKYGKDAEMVPVDEFLEKPVSGETLIKAVNKQLKK
ncbi:MAG: response regulator [Candidatus Ozemobacteraceae bacterium]